MLCRPCVCLLVVPARQRSSSTGATATTSRSPPLRSGSSAASARVQPQRSAAVHACTPLFCDHRLCDDCSRIGSCPSIGELPLLHFKSQEWALGDRVSCEQYVAFLSSRVSVHVACISLLAVGCSCSRRSRDFASCSRLFLQSAICLHVFFVSFASCSRLPCNMRVASQAINLRCLGRDPLAGLQHVLGCGGGPGAGASGAEL